MSDLGWLTVSFCLLCLGIAALCQVGIWLLAAFDAYQRLRVRRAERALDDAWRSRT